MSMTYKRDTKVRFTDMCIYIDNNIYKEDKDVDTIYKYMYLIFYTLASKNRFFKSAQDYDNFSLLGATRLFTRYMNTKLKQIKSVLNYVNTILYPLKVDYQNANFNQVFAPDEYSAQIAGIRQTQTTKIQNYNRELVRVEFEYYLKKIPATIKSFIAKLPHSSEYELHHNLYISCLLSVLSAITLSNKTKSKLSAKLSQTRRIEYIIEKAYSDARADCIILYGLPESMKNLVSTIVNRIFDLIRSDLRTIITTNEPNDAIIESILSSQIKDEERFVNDY